MTSCLVKHSDLWNSVIFLFQVKWSRNAIHLVINWALTKMLFSLHPHPPTHYTHTHTQTLVCTHAHTHKHSVSAPWCAEKMGCRRLDNDTSYTETCKWTASTRAQTPTNTHARLNRNTHAHIPLHITCWFQCAICLFKDFTVCLSSFCKCINIAVILMHICVWMYKYDILCLRCSR